MSYTVSIEYKSGKMEIHRGLTRAVAQAVADHVTSTYPGANASVYREGA